jgi:hypothetical protein
MSACAVHSTHPNEKCWQADIFWQFKKFWNDVLVHGCLNARAHLRVAGIQRNNSWYKVIVRPLVEPILSLCT